MNPLAASPERTLVERARRGATLRSPCSWTLDCRRLSDGARHPRQRGGREGHDPGDLPASVAEISQRYGIPDLFAAWFGRIVVNASRSSMRGRRRRNVRDLVRGPPRRGSVPDGCCGGPRRADRVDRPVGAGIRATLTRRSNLPLAAPLRRAVIGRGRPAAPCLTQDRQVEALFRATRAQRRLEAEDR